MIIELNPFHVGAGPCLFSWRLDRERFLNGPYEFRIVENAQNDSFDVIPLKWQKWIKKRYYPELEEENKEENNGWTICTII